MTMGWGEMIPNMYAPPLDEKNDFLFKNKRRKHTMFKSDIYIVHT